jgi:hypothetical protein
VCPDGTNDIADPDRPLPYTNIVGDADTCGNLVEFAEGKDKEICDLVYRDAGFCGCPGIEKINECSLCPNGESPPEPDRVVEDGFGKRRCGDIELAISYFNEDRCSTDGGLRITTDAYRCGCQDAELPQCPLCRDDDEEKCNLDRCTQKLLNLVPENEQDKECHFFCDGRYSDSSYFTLEADFRERCAAGSTLVWGCNEFRAMANSSVARAFSPIIVLGTLACIVALAF